MSSQTPVAADEARLETREVSPAHFLIKIDSFSLLERINNLTTMQFKAGKYNWRLLIYPNGDGTGKNDKDYVSVYLAITNTTALPLNWEVNATFSICLFNHVSGNYVYSIGRAQRFHELQQEWGFKKFISKKDLKNPSNGYIVGDKCVFGAEVFVHKSKAVIECLSLKSIDKKPYKQEFKISNFSELKYKWVSEEFTVGGHKWKIEAYKSGNGKETGRSLSIFLRHVVSSNLTFSERVLAYIFSCDDIYNYCASSFERVLLPRFTIRIKDQSNNLKHHQYTRFGYLFSASTSNFWGWHPFIKLSSLNDPEKSFIVKDCCVIEIELADVLAVKSTW